MIIVGERLNSSRRPVLQALENRNEQFLLEEALKQEEAGANYIDLNTAALLDKEVEILKWAILLLQEKLSIPLSIDTPNPIAMDQGLKIHKGKALLNSLSGETEKIKSFLPLIKDYKPNVIVLCMDEKGLPQSSEEELAIAFRMIDLLVKEGINIKDVFIDPLVRPLSVNNEAGILFLESLQKIKKSLPEVKTIAGLSNISFGLPKRKLMNRAFLVLALKYGLDAAILDPLDKKLLASLSAAQALLGKDPSLKNYLSHFRPCKQ
jgi:cobalamin-dependent methionine synthase I